MGAKNASQVVSTSGRELVTGAQRALLANLQAVIHGHRWSSAGITLNIEGGPRVFDVRCQRDTVTLWQWVGTAEQILGATDRWLTAWRARSAQEFLREPSAPAPRAGDGELI